LLLSDWFLLSTRLSELLLLSLCAFWFAVEYSFAAAPVLADWFEFAVAVWLLDVARSALLFVVGFAITWPERPKATAIADANKVFFMVVPLKIAS
jgi:hypothetical protein